MERCANCESMIGNLETPFVWRNHVVCAACHRRLEAHHASSAVHAPRHAPAPRAMPAAPLASATLASDACRRRTMAWPWVGVSALVLAVAGAVLYVAAGGWARPGPQTPPALRHAVGGRR